MSKGNISDYLKEIPGFPRYRVSNQGYVIGPRRKITGYANRYGYIMVCLRIENKNYFKAIHRLVALNFIENPNNLPEVNHIDGDKTNNNYSNLEWCDRSRNVKHAYDSGLKVAHPKRGSTHPGSKLTVEKVSELRKKREEGATLKEISEEYGICQTIASRIIRRKSWKHVI